MAIKYLDAKRIRGTAAERAALTVESDAWTSRGGLTYNTTTDEISNVVGHDVAHGAIWKQMKDSSGNVITAGSTWVLQFDWTRVAKHGGSTRPFGICVDTTGADDFSTATGGGVFAYGDDNWNFYWRDGSSRSAAGYIPGNDGTGGSGLPSTVYGVLRRNGSTDVEMRYYTSAARSSLLTSGGNDFTSGVGQFGTLYSTAIPAAALDNLTYLMCSNGSTTSNNEWKINNIKFWNNTTTIPTPSGDPDFENDASGGNLGAATYPNLPAGTIFEQTDDYKYYMWDGTSTWTVVGTT